MKGTEEKLLIYMEGARKRFIIPVYQRNYDWKNEHCKQLYNDLVKIVKQKRHSHFFGSIVSVSDTFGKQSEYLIIDGQQRLTTVSLILLAMYKLIITKTIIPHNKNLASQIFEDFLVDKWEPEETRIKLKPIKNDKTAFEKLFENDDELIIESNLTINFKYFYNRIQKEEISIDELYDALFKLEIINILLNKDDNPQLIFESLNSTGLDLSEGDKIRNYILMGLPSRQQNKLYEKYWNKIEINTSYDVSSFIRDYLSVKQQATPAFRNVYFKFKEYVESKQFEEIEDLLIDILDYSKKYQYLLKANSPSSKINNCIFRLNKIKTTVTRPFLMEILRMLESNKIEEQEALNIFIIVENYIFRRSICDIPTNALNKIFLLLHREILRLDSSDCNYFEKFKYVLLNKTGSGRYPNDSEFTIAFSEKNIYGMRGENKIYLFERLENFGTIETKDIWKHLDNGTYTIEHIMPQTLTNSWINELGDDYERIHSIWLHRIANLTLTAYNSKYSNKTFIEKRNMKNGFIESGLRINQWLGNKDKWTEEELEERDSLLQNKAIELWPYIKSSFEPQKKVLETVSLDEDVVLTSRKITKFSLFGEDHTVSSWTDMYITVLSLLHEEDKSVITKLAVCEDQTVDLSIHFSTSSSEYNAYKTINSSIFVWTGTDTQYKINILKKIFVLFDKEPSDLIFYLNNSNQEKNNIDNRFEIRKKYWSYLIPKLKEKTELFANINPSQENWISSYFGISGISINCVANYDSARVELYIAKAKLEENKQIFDFLYSKKEEIENKNGEMYSWYRGDNLKSSKIYAEIKGVNISNEQDWIKMSNFHINECIKIYLVFKDYLSDYFSK
ncbi:MAG: DUF4268 domain-containing protein [Sphaerochaetaceae bacterium]|nr:DUF4268 domain-containing protein [Sphaerochaetaceae bacterium]